MPQDRRYYRRGWMDRLPKPVPQPHPTPTPTPEAGIREDTLIRYEPMEQLENTLIEYKGVPLKKRYDRLRQRPKSSPPFNQGRL